MPKGESKKQMGVALSDGLRGKLAASSAAAKVSIAEEIRRRLEMSFKNDARDDYTRDLVSAVIWIAGDITAQGSGAYWHATQKGRQAVAAGIRHYIEMMLPAVSAGRGEDLFGPDDPETLGRASARHYRQMEKYADEEGPVPSQEDAERLFRQWGKR